MVTAKANQSAAKTQVNMNDILQGIRQVKDMLAHHARPDELLAAMDLVASVLGRDRVTINEVDPRGELATYCLGAYYEEISSRFEHGFDVSRSRDPAAAQMTRPRGAFLVACSDDLPVGCVGLKGDGRGGAEIKRLWRWLRWPRRACPGRHRRTIRRRRN